MVDVLELSDERDIFEIDDAPIRAKRGQKLTDKELEARYDSGQFHIVTEKNDFLLPQVMDFVDNEQWINLSPEYQRRKRWDDQKKSLLIESLLVNVPIPPVFLYETDLARYEVMDGQQRLNAIVEFYTNQLKLRGMEIWPGLNGKRYHQCPPRIQRGLDRRKISAVILQAESEKSVSKDPLYLRRLVFQRLNTGGEKLNPQELRNAFYQGLFNDLILDLSRLRLFTDIWEIPAYEEFERSDGFVGEPRKSDTLYKTMNDCQIVLRFFAFREPNYVRGSVRSMLDHCMERHRDVNKDTLDEYRHAFTSRLELAHNIFGEDVFRLPPSGRSPGRLSSPLYDAVMIAIDQLWDERDALLNHRGHIKEHLAQSLADKEFYNVVVGRPNTAKAIAERISRVRVLMADEIG